MPPEIAAHHVGLDLQLLGGFHLTVESVPRPGLEKTRWQALIAYLVLQRQTPVPRAQVAFALWPDTREAQALTNLRNLLHRLPEAWPGCMQFIRVDRHTVQWQPHAPWSCDVVEFEDNLVLAVRASNTSDERRFLIQAVTRYRGELLPGHWDEWLLTARGSLHQRYVEALERAATLYAADAEFNQAIHLVERLLADDPLREAHYRWLMRLHVANGDRAGALHAYYQCSRTVQRELGVSPGPPTVAAYEAIVLPAGQRDLRLVAAGTLELPLVGRGAAWQQLLDDWRRLTTGSPTTHCVLVSGEPGIGKSRLVQEFASWTAHQGATVAVAQAYPNDHALPFEPVVQWLRGFDLERASPAWRQELAPLLPDVVDRATVAQASGGHQQLYAALVGVILAQPQPIVLVLDDAQWADQESLAWLHHVLRMDLRARILILLTHPNSQLPVEGPLSTLLADMTRLHRMSHVTLARLTHDETTTLATRLLGHAISPSSGEALFRHSEGNPLFVVEAVRTHPAVFAGTAEADRVPGLADLSPHLQAVLQARLATLSPRARAVLDVAAVIGRSFRADVVALAGSLDRDTLLLGLDELWHCQAVREVDNRRYDFSHDSLRQVVYDRLSRSRRQFLHRRVAKALQAVFGDRIEPQSGDLARHYELAGERAAAVGWYRRAAAAARRVYANTDAIVLSDKALALAQELADEAPTHPEREALLQLQADILSERDWTWRLLGQIGTFQRDVARLHALATELGDLALQARSARREAFVLYRFCRFGEAGTAAQRAIALCQQTGQPLDEAHSYALLGRAQRALGDFAGAVQALETARRITIDLQNSIEEVHCLSFLSTAYLLQDDEHAAYRLAQEALTLCDRAGLVAHRRFALGDLGAAAAGGDPVQAEAWLNESLAIARQVSDRTQEVFCLGHLGWLAVRQGRGAEARTQLQEAFDLAVQADLYIYRPWLLAGRARAHQLCHDRTQAHGDAQQAVQLAQEFGLPVEQALARRILDDLA
jgi:DNA-binding SARP family transcriptional activator/predicted ATPase